MTNTFTVLEADKGAQAASFGRLSPTQFLSRLKDEPGGKGKAPLVILQTDGKKARYCRFPSLLNEELAAKAAASGVTIDENGKIAKYESRVGLTRFLREAAAIPGMDCHRLRRESAP
jgi:hypothetical protein